MISTAMQNAINKQIAREFYASHLYLSMRAFFESRDFSGFAHWMRLQAEEERAHALKLFDYLLDRGGQVLLGAIEQPPSEFDSVLQAFEQALGHEQQVSADINELYSLAREEHDNPTQVMLQWFIAEQVEEESTASRIVNRLKLVNGDPTGLLLLDNEMANRQPEAEEAAE